MELDQIVFKKVYDFIKKMRTPKADAESEARTVCFAVIKPRLTILARALTGEAIELFTAEREGGWAGQAFFMPERYGRAATPQENIDFYVFRVCFLAVQKSLRCNWHTNEHHTVDESRRRAAASAPQVLDALYCEFPMLHDLAERIIQQEMAFQKVQAPEQSPDCSMLWGRWMSPHEAPAGMVGMPSLQDKPEEQTTPTTELQAPAREEVDTLTVDNDKVQEYTLMHSFEKVDTIEEFNGNWRDFDGEDELNDQAEALSELDLRETVRVDTPTHSVYQAEFFRNASAPESRDAQEQEKFFIPYDEWDNKKKVYKPQHCKVFPSVFVRETPDYAAKTLVEHRTTLSTLRRKLAYVQTELESVKRQSMGEEPDIDAVVTNFSDIQAGHTPSENIYLSKRRRRRDLSVLLLMDRSLSTDAYASGKRVLDVEKQSVILFADILSEYGDRFQIDCFSSHTRNHCDYTTIKGFDESWHRGKQRIGAVEPRGYTRIGPALRHATALMSKEPTRQRWILLLSDGKPNDYDRYEGAYGIADVRQALREARQQKVQVHALAVESEAKYYLPLMLGQGGYRILPFPAQLPDALTQFYAALMQ